VAQEQADGNDTRVPTIDGHDYTEADQAVFAAVAEAQREHGGEAAMLDDIATAAGMSHEDTRDVLHGLVAEHKLVTELDNVDTPDLGPRFEVAQRW
jgi:hypothetical protein